MWFRSKPAKAADITAAELRAEFAECRAEVRGLQLEWERTYAKLRGIVARMSRKSSELEDVPAPDITPASPGKLGKPLTAAPSAVRIARGNY